jgi:hypothetical protein
VITVYVDEETEERTDNGGDDVWHCEVVAGVDFTVVELYLEHGGSHDYGVDNGYVGAHARTTGEPET